LVPALLVVGLCFVGLALMGVRVVETSRDLRVTLADDISWVVAQLEVDHQRVLIALQAAQLYPDGPATGRPAIQSRFDIYFSRVQTVMARTASLPPGQSGGRDRQDSLRKVLDNLTEVAVIIDDLGPEDRDALARATTLLQSIAADVRLVVVDTVLTSQTAAQDLRIRRETLLQQFALAGIMVLILVTTLLVVVVRLFQQASTRSKMMERLDASLRSAFEAAIVAVVVVDNQGVVVSVNGAAETLFRRNRDAVVGYGLSSLLGLRSDKVRAGDDARLVSRIANRGRRRLRLRRSGGAFLPVEVSVVSGTGPNGTQIYIGFVRDITAEVAADRQRRSKMHQAEQEADQKARFLAAASHELRTPMQGVLAAIDLALHPRPNGQGTTGSDQASTALLRIAQESAVAALDQIDHVLDIAALDEAEAQGVPGDTGPDETFDPALVASDLIGAALRARAADGLDIRLERAADIPACVSGQPRAYRQALRNLIGNAVKFGAQHRISVRQYVVGSDAFPPSGGARLRTEVRDNGIGIAAKDQARIFDDFEMLDRGYARKTGGIGLGLGIARRAVQRMGGKIGVISAPGQGSLFWFDIPLSAAAHPVSAASPAGPLRVLVVDDQAVNRLLIQKMVTVYGHHADQAEDGARAVAMAGRTAYDVILMDISMPGMDGISATRLIREAGASQSTEIVGVTANLQSADRPRALRSGMHEVLIKPVRPADIERLLGRFRPKADPQLSSKDLPGMGAVARDAPGLSGQACRAVQSPAGRAPLTAPVPATAGPVIEPSAAAGFAATPSCVTVGGADEAPQDLAAAIADAVSMLAVSLGPERVRNAAADLFASCASVLAKADSGMDTATLCSAAHRCAGTAALFGALPVHAAFCALEDAALGGDPGAISQCIPACRAALDTATQLINAALGATES
jgi:PAS domain S-box-containing protein